MENKRLLHSHKVDILYTKKYSIYLSSFIVGSIFTYVFYDPANKNIICAWLGLFATYLALRYLTTEYYSKNISKTRENPKKWENIYAVTTLFGGLIWGLSAPVFLTNNDPSKLVIAVMAYLGVVTGSLPANAPSIKASIAFIWAALIPVAINFFSHNHDLSNIQSALTILGTIIYTVGAYSLYKVISHNIKLRLEKERFIDKIEASNQQRITAERQVMQSSKLASIGEMASGIAHEINNPLTIISGNLIILSKKVKEVDEDNSLQKYIDKCEKNVVRIAKVVKSLKRMSYDGLDDDFRKISIGDIVDDALGFSEEKLKTVNVELIKELNDEAQLVLCNSIQISQVILNLVTNSMHAISSEKDPWIKISSHIKDKYMYLYVTDSGTGIPEDMREKIFDPFFTTKGVNQGTGLGLSLSKTMSLKSGGDLIYDEEFENTRFILTIPLAADEPYSQSA